MGQKWGFCRRLRGDVQKSPLLGSKRSTFLASHPHPPPHKKKSVLANSFCLQRQNAYSLEDPIKWKEGDHSLEKCDHYHYMHCKIVTFHFFGTDFFCSLVLNLSRESEIFPFYTLRDYLKPLHPKKKTNKHVFLVTMSLTYFPLSLSNHNKKKVDDFNLSWHRMSHISITKYEWS